MASLCLQVAQFGCAPLTGSVYATRDNPREIMNRESVDGDNSNRVPALYRLYCDLVSTG
jgi:hypothetical protein